MVLLVFLENLPQTHDLLGLRCSAKPRLHDTDPLGNYGNCVAAHTKLNVLACRIITSITFSTSVSLLCNYIFRAL